MATDGGAIEHELAGGGRSVVTRAGDVVYRLQSPLIDERLRRRVAGDDNPVPTTQARPMRVRMWDMTARCSTCGLKSTTSASSITRTL